MIAAGMMVRDEADVIVQTLAHLHDQGIGRIYMLDNLSSDGTSALLAALPRRWNVTVEQDMEPGYYQSRKMTRLLRRAWDDGYRWFVPCDADELWSAESEFDTLEEILLGQPDHVAGVMAGLYDHYCTRRDDAWQTDPFKRMLWRVPEAQSLPKVAVRTSPSVVIEMGNHGAKYENGTDLIFAQGRPLRIDHYPYRSADQFIKKARNGAAAYLAAPDLPEDAGVHWRQYGRILDAQGEAGLRAWFREHFYYDEPERSLVKDARYAAAA